MAVLGNWSDLLGSVHPTGAAVALSVSLARPFGGVEFGLEG